MALVVSPNPEIGVAHHAVHDAGIGDEPRQHSKLGKLVLESAHVVEKTGEEVAGVGVVGIGVDELAVSDQGVIESALEIGLAGADVAGLPIGEPISLRGRAPDLTEGFVGAPGGG